MSDTLWDYKRRQDKGTFALRVPYPKQRLKCYMPFSSFQTDMGQE
jgi:hypothetical protein